MREGERCECRDVDKGGERIVKGRDRGVRDRSRSVREMGKHDERAENAKRKREGRRFGGEETVMRRGDKHRNEQEQRTMCAALVTEYVIGKKQLKSLHEVQPFKCAISSFSISRVVCQNMTGCHIQAATHSETSSPVQEYTLYT